MDYNQQHEKNIMSNAYFAAIKDDSYLWLSLSNNNPNCQSFPLYLIGFISGN